MNADGSGLRVLDFKEENQVTWQPAGFFPDGQRVLFLSMEARRDGPGRPFSEYYTQTPTRIWIYDLEDESLTEIATEDRMAVFYTPQLLLGDGAHAGTGGTSEGWPSLQHEPRWQRGPRVHWRWRRSALRLRPQSGDQASRLSSGQSVGLSDLDQRFLKVAAGTWSPVVKTTSTLGPPGPQMEIGLPIRIATLERTPGHDWSDVCISRPDGSEQRVLTRNQPHWFGASYGSPERRGSGSNMLTWTRAGSILFSRKLPRSKVAWEFRALRPDTDHFNRDYKPELARGGTEICQLDPRNDEVQRLTQSDPPVWDFRAIESPDGKAILFCRAEVGKMPGIWLREGHSVEPRHLTDGLDNQGADHPRWVP